MMKTEGVCLCGALRYGSDAGPGLQAVCRCRTCQKIIGSTYPFHVAVAEESLVVEGAQLVARNSA